MPCSPHGACSQRCLVYYSCSELSLRTRRREYEVRGASVYLLPPRLALWMCACVWRVREDGHRPASCAPPFYRLWKSRKPTADEEDRLPECMVWRPLTNTRECSAIRAALMTDVVTSYYNVHEHVVIQCTCTLHVCMNVTTGSVQVILWLFIDCTRISYSVDRCFFWPSMN